MAAHPELQIDATREAERIVGFIRSELDAAGLPRVVVGMSGGVDSAAVACLCAHAAGPENVLGVFLPYRTSPSEGVEHASAVAEVAGIRTERVEITPAVDAVREMLGTEDRVRLGNVMARARMIVLYDRSAQVGGLVAGTGNRTEAMLGYATLHGDSACAFRPIGHLYKCQVRRLAEHLGVPADIIRKPPSADLWHGQTDEGELGIAYDEADWLLYNMLDRQRTDAELEAMGFRPELVGRVRALIEKSAFKRRMPNGLPSRDGMGRTG